MTAKESLQGQGMSNVLQTIIALGIVWMASTLNSVSITIAEQAKDISQHERRITALEVEK